MLFDSKKKKFKVDYHGQINRFTGAKEEYKEGSEVELSYGLIATDTDYTFYVDGNIVNAKWDNNKGYIIRFTMPSHDIEVYCKAENSMEKRNF